MKPHERYQRAEPSDEERYARKRPYDDEYDNDRENRDDEEDNNDSVRGTKRMREYNDLDPNFDRHGHPATNKLFLDKLPTSVREETVRNMFKHFTKALVSIQLGNKELKQV
jgi:RNA recognition motif-containing protein